MRSPPVTVQLSDSVLSIGKKMVKENAGAVIVMSGDSAVGIVTERDMVEKVLMRCKDPAKIHAEDIMSKQLVSLEADRPVVEALGMMRDRNVRRLVVTRNGKLVGIVTERRLLDSLI